MPTRNQLLTAAAAAVVVGLAGRAAGQGPPVTPGGVRVVGPGTMTTPYGTTPQVTYAPYGTYGYSNSPTYTAGAGYGYGSGNVGCVGCGTSAYPTAYSAPVASSGGCGGGRRGLFRR